MDSKFINVTITKFDEVLIRNFILIKKNILIFKVIILL